MKHGVRIVDTQKDLGGPCSHGEKLKAFAKEARRKSPETAVIFAWCYSIYTFDTYEIPSGMNTQVSFTGDPSEWPTDYKQHHETLLQKPYCEVVNDDFQS